MIAQERQLRRRQLQRALDNRRPHELTFLQTLGKQAQGRPVPRQNLHIVAALAREHEGRARIRVSAQNLRDIGGKSIKAAPHIDRLARQIHLHARRELKHQRSPSADRTRRNASASTSASSDTRAPLGRLISIAPRRVILRGSRTGFVDANASTGSNAGAVTAFSSTSVTGTNAGASLASATAEASAFCAGARRRSSQPSRARRIHLKTRLAFRPIRRAFLPGNWQAAWRLCRP
nr:Conserved hypothetical protein [Methylocystis sp. SC2]